MAGQVATVKHSRTFDWQGWNPIVHYAVVATVPARHGSLTSNERHPIETVIASGGAVPDTLFFGWPRCCRPLGEDLNDGSGND